MYEFVDESFRLENTFEYILSIQVSLNGFSFSIRKEDAVKPLLLKVSPFKISGEQVLARHFQDWYSSEEILHKPYRRTIVIVPGNSFTMVPEHYSNKKILEEIPHLLFNEADKMDFAKNHVKSINASLYFALPKGLNETIQKTIGECTITHPLKALLNKTSKTEEPQLRIFVNKNDLILTVHKSGTLAFCNRFNVNHANDIIYYALSTLKQLDIQQGDTEVLWGGKSAFNNELIPLLNTYFKSVELFGNTLKDAGISESDVVNENISLFLV